MSYGRECVFLKMNCGREHYIITDETFKYILIFISTSIFVLGYTIRSLFINLVEKNKIEKDTKELEMRLDKVLKSQLSKFDNNSKLSNMKENTDEFNGIVQEAKHKKRELNDANDI